MSWSFKLVKRIAILGSTGSIGTSALRVVESLGEDYQVYGLSANSSVELLAEQARRYEPRVIALTNPEYVEALRGAVGDLDIKVLFGAESLVELAADDDVDVLLTAVVGLAGLRAVLAAAVKGKVLAIANKEALVVAGELLMGTAAEHGSIIVPVDSEHSAVFQAMQSGRVEEVSRIILTASGGPFRDKSFEEMYDATVKEALSHPVWSMGPKITIDSATMMNKALEVIEARRLFDIEAEKLEVLIHPQSIVHSLVEFVDGSVVGQLGYPDMSLPIQYALTYPERVEGSGERLRLDEVGELTFYRPDFERFRGLALGFEVARSGGTTAAVFNGANEKAVEEFLAGRIKFGNIVELTEHCLDKHEGKSSAGLEELFEADTWARKEVTEWIKQKV